MNTIYFWSDKVTTAFSSNPIEWETEQYTTPEVMEQEIITYDKKFGREPIIVLCYALGYINNLACPVEQIKKIWEMGRLPLVMVMPIESWANAGVAGGYWDIERFINGNLDNIMYKFANDLNSTGIPCIISPFWEVSARSWHWAGHHHGGINGGPARFALAFKKFAKILKEVVQNVTVLFQTCYNQEDEWNRSINYYEGIDEVVDILGLQIGYDPIYNPDPRSLVEKADIGMAELRECNQNKPKLLEIYTVELPGSFIFNKPRELQLFFSHVRSGRWPDLKIVEGWDDDQMYTDLYPRGAVKLDSSPASKSAWKNGVQSYPFSSLFSYT